MTASAPGAGFLAAATYNPPDGAGLIINILAWCVTAAGVFGVMVVGINMAIQLNRGEPGEGVRGALLRHAPMVPAATDRPVPPRGRPSAAVRRAESDIPPIW